LKLLLIFIEQVKDPAILVSSGPAESGVIAKHARTPLELGIAG